MPPFFLTFYSFFFFAQLENTLLLFFYTALAWFLCVSKSVIITIGVDFDTLIFSLSLCCIQSIYTYIQPLLYIQHIHTPFFILSLSLFVSPIFIFIIKKSTSYIYKFNIYIFNNTSISLSISFFLSFFLIQCISTVLNTLVQLASR